MYLLGSSNFYLRNPGQIQWELPKFFVGPMGMTESDRMRFLQRALDEKLISAVEYEELAPRMLCRVGTVLLAACSPKGEPPQKLRPPLDVGKQELVAQLAQCVIQVVQQQGTRTIDEERKTVPEPHSKTLVQSNQALSVKNRSFAFPADKSHALSKLDPLKVTSWLQICRAHRHVDV